MSDEISGEAAVAGVAAAAAVEEFQSRQELDQEVTTAAIEANTAVTMAEGAADASQTAYEQANEALAVSQSVAESLSDTEEAVVATATVAYATAEELSALRAQNEELTTAVGEMRQYLNERLPVSTEPDFEEVSVTDGVSNSGGEHADSSSGEEGSSTPEGAAPEKSARKKLRHRSR